MKKVILAITIILSVLFTGCYNDNYDSIDISFDSFEAMASWMATKIEYKSDIVDEWQSPEETYRLRTGDCEDMAFLASYFLKQLGISHEVVLGNVLNGMVIINRHCYLYINSIRKYYDPERNLVLSTTKFRSETNCVYSTTLFSYKI